MLYNQSLKVKMKQQTTDENIQLILKRFEIDHPKRKCSSGNIISHICINSSCESNALFCGEQTCSNCFKSHMICEHINMKSFTYLLQKQAEGQREFIIKIFEIENLIVQQIKVMRKEIVQKLYLGDLQDKFLRVIEPLYIKKQQDLKLKGKLAGQTYEMLKRSAKEVVQPDKQLLQSFKAQVLTFVAAFKDTQRMLISQYAKKSKIISNPGILQNSTIITKENTNYLNFLNQSFLRVKGFKLLFRASEHGFQAAKFHQHCDNTKHTFTLIKTEFGKVIGGYTPLKWNEAVGTGYVADNQGLSFLLSFNLNHKMRIIQRSRAIYNNPECGPIFGSGCDIYISDKCNLTNCVACFPTSYSSNGIYQKNQQTFTAFTGAKLGFRFKVSQYEVYQVYW